MANYLVTHLNTLIITHGKLADLTYAYDGESIVIVDLARTQADKIDHMYQFMEDLKNGRVFSTKYESGNKYFKPPHVVVFANFVPDEDQQKKIWSEDCWCVYSLENYEVCH